MVVFNVDKRTGLSCGINDFGELFFGNNKSGYNLPDTPENKQYMADQWDAYIEGESNG